MQWRQEAKRATGHACSHPACCGHPTAVEDEASAYHTGEGPSRPADRGATLWDSFKSWLLWFLAFFGIYASSSVCVFCGTPGCPVGAGGAALVGGIFTVFWRYAKDICGGLALFLRKVFS